MTGRAHELAGDAAGLPALVLFVELTEPEDSEELEQLIDAQQRARDLARDRAWKQSLADNGLIERFCNGDTEAFSELAAKYQYKLMGVVSRLIHDRADAEDIVQEALIKAYRALPGFRNDSSFYTWLFTVALNTARNFKIAQNRRGALCVPHPKADDEVDYDENEMVDIQTPLAELEQKRLLYALNDALDSMPEHLSYPLVLCQIEGMSYEEIAATMLCPPGTVRSRVFRARELMAAKMAHLVNLQVYRRKERQ